MTKLVLLAGVLSLLSGCGMAPRGSAPVNTANAAAAAEPTAPNGFPRAGTYTVVADRADGRDETTTYIDVSDGQKFEARFGRDDGRSCRDKTVSIGGGRFNVRMTCDAPDGDIHNIVEQRFGSYTDHSIDETLDITLGRLPIRETRQYRFLR